MYKYPAANFDDNLRRYALATNFSGILRRSAAYTRQVAVGSTSKRLMRTANYSELRNNLKHYLDGVINDSEPLLVHRSGNESVVVISLEEYNAIKETEYIMKSPAMMEVIRQGEAEIQQGKGKAVNPDELWK